MVFVIKFILKKNMFILKIDIFEFYCGIFLMGLFLFVGGVDKFMLM